MENQKTPQPPAPEQAGGERTELVKSFRATGLNRQEAVSVANALAATPTASPAAPVAAKPAFNGWYCAHCQRGVDCSEVTYHEQHTVCGRVITDDEPPVAAKPEQDKRRCHAEGDRCPGCAHYYGKADVCIYAPTPHPQPQAQGEPEAVSSIDHAQKRGHLGSPEEWVERCRLFRVRCNLQDVANIAKLRTYIEEGTLVVLRPEAIAKRDAAIVACVEALKSCKFTHGAFYHKHYVYDEKLVDAAITQANEAVGRKEGE